MSICVYLSLHQTSHLIYAFSLYTFSSHTDEVNEVMIKSSWSGMLAALSLLLNAWYVLHPTYRHSLDF